MPNLLDNVKDPNDIFFISQTMYKYFTVRNGILKHSSGLLLLPRVATCTLHPRTLRRQRSARHASPSHEPGHRLPKTPNATANPDPCRPTGGGPGAGLLRRMNNLKAHLPNYWCSLRLKRNQWCAGCARALGARGVPGVSLVLENLPGQNFPGQPGSNPGQDRQ